MSMPKNFTLKACIPGSVRARWQEQMHNSSGSLQKCATRHPTARQKLPSESLPLRVHGAEVRAHEAPAEHRHRHDPTLVAGNNVNGDVLADDADVLENGRARVDETLDPSTRPRASVACKGVRELEARAGDVANVSKQDLHNHRERLHPAASSSDGACPTRHVQQVLREAGHVVPWDPLQHGGHCRCELGVHCCRTVLQAATKWLRTLTKQPVRHNDV